MNARGGGTPWAKRKCRPRSIRDHFRSRAGPCRQLRQRQDRAGAPAISRRARIFLIKRSNQLVDELDHLGWILFHLDLLSNLSPAFLRRLGLALITTHRLWQFGGAPRKFLRDFLYRLDRNLFEMRCYFLHVISTLTDSTVPALNSYGVYLLGILWPLLSALNLSNYGDYALDCSRHHSTYGRVILRPAFCLQDNVLGYYDNVTLV